MQGADGTDHTRSITAGGKQRQEHLARAPQIHPGIQQALESPRRVSASLCWMPLDCTWLKDTLNYPLSEQAVF